MDRISDKRKCMASLAVFRDLYNQKKDIYCIIAEFIKLAIAEDALSTFNLQQMVNIIKQKYGFDLPIAIIKRALGKLDFLNKDKSSYTIKKDITFDADEIRKNTQNEDAENQKVIESLHKYVENKLDKKLSTQETMELCNDFCSFIIDDTNSLKYGQYISQFIIEQSEDKALVSQLNQIKQGVVIFVGLNYNADFNTIDKLDTPLHIYLDTEIIFHMFGLNGDLYKNLFDEFYKLVQEINQKSKKTIIKLKYFAENKDEIDSYFKIAERIVRKEEQLNPSKQAMCNIVNGCFDATQIIEKKAELFKTLSDKNITIDTQEHYYDKEINWNFLIESKSFYEYKDDDTSEKDIDRKVKLLNYISIKRGYKNQSIFRTIGHILLSANKVTFNIAFAPSVKEANNIPLATNLSFLTNRFWMSLNKGLSNLSTLNSINVISKAQMALSARINDNVGKLFSQFIEDDKIGKFDTEKKKALLAELHKSTISPDDLNSNNADTYVDILSINDINTFIAEKELSETKNQKALNNTIKQMEEMKELLKRTQEEHDLQASEQNTIIKNAALKILSNRNKEEEEEYKKQENDYIKELTKYKKRKKTKDWLVNIIVIIIHLLIIIALFLYNYFTNKNDNNLFISIIIIIGALITVLASIPFCNLEKIHNAYKYLICSSYREYLNNQHEEDFRKKYPEPVLNLTSIEDIMKELKNNKL